MAEMIDVLMRYYGLSEQGAAEVIAELRDRTSLSAIACNYRMAARAVPTSTPPTSLTGKQGASSPPLVG